MSSLKPCPFCGSSPFLMRKEIEANGRRYFKIFIGCNSSTCGAYIPNGAFSTLDYSMEEAEEKAIKKWNHRYKNNDSCGFDYFVLGALDAARQVIVNRYKKEKEDEF